MFESDGLTIPWRLIIRLTWRTPGQTSYWLGEDEPWSNAPELGSASMLVDQDTDNLMRIQRGLRTTRKPGVTLSRYQESRVRHFNQTLDAYMAG